MDWIVKSIVAIFCLFVFYKMAALYLSNKSNLANLAKKKRILLTGFVANIADTLGLGSFAVVVALNNRFKMVDDKRLPGTLNAHSVLPAMLQSLLFLNFVQMDYLLLVTFVFAACIGGVFGGLLMARMDKQTIRAIMGAGFIGIGILILAHQLHLLPFAGEATSLPPGKLVIGSVAMFLVGMLPSIGVGFYVPIQVILFFLGLSPLIAFPVMTTAGAIVQSATAYTFVVKKEIALEESLLLTLSGLAGVAIAVPMITLVNMTTLRWLLLGIVLYNGGMMWKSYREGLNSELRTMKSEV